MPKRASKTSGLLTLSDVAKKTGISMPSLLRYKKEHQGRIPAVGKGRRQRYPMAALAVFQAIKRENMANRGGRAASGGKAAAAGGLLSLSEIGRRTGISYPTLLRYVKLHAERLPHRGRGRSRRFLPAAVAAFEELRRQSRRGRRKVESTVAGFVDRVLLGRLDRIERTQARLAKELRDLAKTVERPLRLVLKR